MLYKIISFFMTLTISLFSLFGVTIERQGFLLNTDRMERNITASQNERLEQGTLTGAHIIVHQNGESVFNKTFGKTSADGGALRTDATYRIASMTKPVTALAMLIEYERGHLDIYADVGDYIEGFRTLTVKKEVNGQTVTEPAKNPMKVYMLVSHISGIDPDAFNDALSLPIDKLTCAGVTDYISALPLKYEPGTVQEYNTVSFDVAARIIELVSGLEFEEYLKINIFDKLGMTDTTFEPTPEQFGRMVAIHGMENGKAVDLPSSPGCVFANIPMTYHVAGGGLMSTAEDYARFAEMLLAGGRAPDGTQIVSEAMIKLMATPCVPDSVMPGNQKWGLGVRVITDDDYPLPKGTFGWSGAYGTHFWVDPVNRITAVYMKNSGYDGGAGCQTANELEKDIMNAVSIRRIK